MDPREDNARDPDEFDLELDDSFQDAHSPAPLPQTPQSAQTKSQPSEPPQPKQPKFARLEKRTDGEAKRFRRLMARPSALFSQSSGQSRASAPAPGSSAPEPPQVYGKKRDADVRPEMQPNKVIAVLEGVDQTEQPWWVDPARFNRYFRWILLVALVAACVLLLWRFISGASRSSLDGRGSGATASLESREQQLEMARQIMEKYFAAPSWEEKANLVLEADRVRPKMDAYYNAQGRKDPEFSAADLQDASSRGGKYWMVFKLRGSGSEASRPIRLQRVDAQGHYRIDWEHFTGSGEMPWEQFCQDRPTEAKEMRVQLAANGESAGKYTAGEYDAYVIRHCDGGRALRGYVAKRDRVAQDLKTAVGKPGAQADAVVFLKFEPDTEPDQVRIESAPEVIPY